MAAIARWLRNLRRRRRADAHAWVDEIVPTREAIGAYNTLLAYRVRERQLDSGLLKAVQVALDELLTNVVMHADQAAGARIHLNLDCEHDWIEAGIRYQAAAFDPTAGALPDVSAPLAERSLGGLGLLLVHQLMDVFEHSYVDGYNQLRIRKQLAPR